MATRRFSRYLAQTPTTSKIATSRTASPDLLPIIRVCMVRIYNLLISVDTLAHQLIKANDPRNVIQIAVNSGSIWRGFALFCIRIHLRSRVLCMLQSQHPFHRLADIPRQLQHVTESYIRCDTGLNTPPLSHSSIVAIRVSSPRIPTPCRLAIIAVFKARHKSSIGHYVPSTIHGCHSN